MKTSKKILGIVSAAMMAICLSSCDGMWVGVDSDAGYGGPYYANPGWFNGYYGPNYGAGIVPPSRPIIGGVGPVIPPGGVVPAPPTRPSAPSQPNRPSQPSQPSQPNRPSGPSFSPSQPSNPGGGVNSPVTAPNGNQRPGNMGRP